MRRATAPDAARAVARNKGTARANLPDRPGSPATTAKSYSRPGRRPTATARKMRGCRHTGGGHASLCSPRFRICSTTGRMHRRLSVNTRRNLGMNGRQHGQTAVHPIIRPVQSGWSTVRCLFCRGFLRANRLPGAYAVTCSGNDGMCEGRAWHSGTGRRRSGCPRSDAGALRMGRPQRKASGNRRSDCC